MGVARERRKEDMVNALKKDGYPWMNLLELEDQNNIWNKYNCGNGGGRILLVDENGKILALSLAVKEIEKILREKFGE